jgi:hypothetical protein
MTDRQAFEAKHYAMRKSRDGTIISFVVHPSDLTPELNCLAIGARVMIGWQEIGDDEKPAGRAANGSAAKGNDRAVEARDETAHRSGSGSSPERPAPKPDRRKFHDLPLAQQAALRCGDSDFQAFLTNKHRIVVTSDEYAAQIVRTDLGVQSRSELGKGNHDADNKWRRLETEFQNWLTDNRYADTIR